MERCMSLGLGPCFMYPRSRTTVGSWVMNPMCQFTFWERINTRNKHSKRSETFRDDSSPRNQRHFTGQRLEEMIMKRAYLCVIAVLILAPGRYAQTAPDAGELTRLLKEFLAGASRNDAAVHDRF